MGLLCAEQDVGNLKKNIVRDYGTPMRRTRRWKYQQMYFQEFWDSCTQNERRKSQKHELSRIMGRLCAEQNVGNLKKTRSGILGLLCAEQNVVNLKNCTFRKFGTPVRRTKRRKN